MTGEPTNWIDRIDSLMSWGKRHPFLAKVLTGIFMLVVGGVALAYQVQTTGHE